MIKPPSKTRQKIKKSTSEPQWACLYICSSVQEKATSKYVVSRKVMEESLKEEAQVSADQRETPFLKEFRSNIQEFRNTHLQPETLDFC